MDARRVRCLNEEVSVRSRVRISVPDAASGERLQDLLEDLDAELRGLPVRDLEVVVTLKTAAREIVLGALLENIRRWMYEEELFATRVHVGDQPRIVRLEGAAYEPPGVLASALR
jgi:hypothetical protein